MGVNINDYIDCDMRYALYGEHGDYINYFILITMIVDELGLSMSINDIKKFVDNCEISLTKEDIKKFLSEKMDEKNPSIRTELDKKSESLSGKPLEYTKEYIIAESNRFNYRNLRKKYEFDLNLLKTYKKDSLALKLKCQKLLRILEALSMLEHDDILKENMKILTKSNLHIKFGNLAKRDSEQFVDAIVYNVRELYQKIMLGNNLNTYLNYNEWSHLEEEDKTPGTETFNPKRKLEKNENV